MSKRLLVVAVVAAVSCSIALAGTGKKKGAYQEVLAEPSIPAPEVPYTRVPDPDWTQMRSEVGVPTTLSGFYDYQSNGGALQHIRVNPANGNIHTIYMLAEDSVILGTSRRTAYAFSSNGGVTWTNFNNVRVPARASGFPTIDLLRGANAGLPVIANHSAITGTQSTIFVDSPEGTGAFSELNAPAVIAPATQPIWPYIAGTSDGSVMLMASQNDPNLNAGIAHYNRMPNDFSGWTGWTDFPGDVQSGGRYPVQANGTGRVGILLNTGNGTAVLGNRWIESTNNGQTWSAPQNVFSFRAAGTDTFNTYVHADFVYNGDTPYMAFTEYITNERDDVNIVFWSQATGFRVAVPWDSTKYFFDPVNQRFHAFQLGWPSIGLSGNTIVIAYQGFQRDVDTRNYNYSDLWYVASSNGGMTWGAPQRITNTTTTDERYPSVSKWNAPGEFNMVWSQKSKSGLFAFPGGADTVRTSQMFLRVNPIVFGTTSVGQDDGVVNSFKLGQNYPNPFNPATKIDYTVAQEGLVTIKVYNMLGQEVGTILNETLAPGTYQTAFDGGTLPSGVYLYTMKAGSYVESRKMVLMK